MRELQFINYIYCTAVFRVDENDFLVQLCQSTGKLLKVCVNFGFKPHLVFNCIIQRESKFKL